MDPIRCEACGTEIQRRSPKGPAPKTCSAACRNVMYRRRRTQKIRELETVRAELESGLYEVVAEAPAGEIRDAAVELVRAVEYAARRAGKRWRPERGRWTATPQDMARVIEIEARRVVAAVIASSSDSQLQTAS